MGKLTELGLCAYNDPCVACVMIGLLSNEVVKYPLRIDSDNWAMFYQTFCISRSHRLYEYVSCLLTNFVFVTHLVIY